MVDRSSGFPVTNTRHDLATSSVSHVKPYITEPADHHEGVAEGHLMGLPPAPPIGGHGGAPDPGGHRVPIDPGGGAPGGPVRLHQPIHIRTPDPIVVKTPPPHQVWHWPIIFPPKKPPVAGPPGSEGPPGAPGQPGAPGTPGAASGGSQILLLGGALGNDQNQQPQQDQPQSQGASPLAIVAILAVIGVGAYFYMQHEKHQRSGGESHGEHKEPPKREEEKKE